MGMGMHVSSGSNVANQGGVAAWQQRQQSFKALSQALSADDLGAAKAAYASMTGSSNAISNSNSPLAQLGKALQSDDLASAQQAFSQMRSNSQSGGSAARPTVPSATLTSGNNVNVYV